MHVIPESTYYWALEWSETLERIKCARFSILNLTDPADSAYRGGGDRDHRRPTSAELGLDVTVGIVVVASADNCFVTATDQMVSYGDVYPAADQGVLKTLRFAKNWYVNFAASDIAMFPPFFMALRTELRSLDDEKLTHAQVKSAAAAAYSRTFHEQFVATNLTQLGFKTINDFRQEGLTELGKDAFGEYLERLAKFRLGLEITIFGFNEESKQRIFEVHDPGRIVDIAFLGCSVIGSGYHMAISSLRRKPMPLITDDIIYRALEAKFTSETASGVGRNTTLGVVSLGGARVMKREDVAAIRDVWSATLNEPTPAGALAVIEKSGLINDL